MCPGTRSILQSEGFRTSIVSAMANLHQITAQNPIDNGILQGALMVDIHNFLAAAPTLPRHYCLAIADLRKR